VLLAEQNLNKSQVRRLPLRIGIDKGRAERERARKDREATKMQKPAQKQRERAAAQSESKSKQAAAEKDRLERETVAKLFDIYGVPPSKRSILLSVDID
jgi:hypothetical protein